MSPATPAGATGPAAPGTPGRSTGAAASGAAAPGTAASGTSARDRILARVRAALSDVPAEERENPAPIARDYLRAHVPDDPEAVAGLLAENLADYRARVHRTTAAGLPALIARLLADRGARTVVVPPGLPDGWLAAADVTQLRDDGTLTPARLDAVDSVVTGCALAVAETGTIVLDAGPGQGRRLLTLVPDHHVCVVRVPGQVVASVPQALPRLDPRRPLTWISGPSATSDIELNRVEGVHGPRTLDAVLVTD
ncbi:lactate utilization protein C [Streptomyces thermolineatus]|uniref:LutC/YkgG family protein n=1 Tax=Streptomyces thermolineatus TaxID=44033 RepID=UPI00384F924C